MRRRTFLKWSVKAGLITAVSMAGWGCSRESKDGSQAIRMPPLPYGFDALEPYISEETLEFHYGKHHASYVEKLNKLVADSDFKGASLVQIIREGSGAIFNNGAQVWNHSFYWNCMKPNAKSPNGEIADAIGAEFGSYEKFKQLFNESAINNFGSGWTWLVKDSKNSLKIVNTSNAANPLTENMTPLLTCDVWEHAYYIDYRNARAKYLDAFWNIVNWDFVSEQLKHK